MFQRHAHTPRDVGGIRRAPEACRIAGSRPSATAQARQVHSCSLVSLQHRSCGLCDTIPRPDISLRGAGASEQCKKRKLKCEPGSNGGDCQRCAGSGLICDYRAGPSQPGKDRVEKCVRLFVQPRGRESNQGHQQPQHPYNIRRAETTLRPGYRPVWNDQLRQEPVEI